MLGVGLVLVVGFFGFAYLLYSCQSGPLEAANGFFDHLRHDRVQPAWASLAPSRRASTDLDAFQRLSDQPVLRHHTEAAFGNAPTWGPVDGLWHACTSGDLTYEGANWPVEVHLTQGDDGIWRVADWAVGKPSSMSETMLEVCKTAW